MKSQLVPERLELARACVGSARDNRSAKPSYLSISTIKNIKRVPA